MSQRKIEMDDSVRFVGFVNANASKSEYDIPNDFPKKS